MTWFTIASATMLGAAGAAHAETLRILTAGAFKQVLLAVLPQFEQPERSARWENDTVGNLVKRIEGGEEFDLVIVSPAALRQLQQSGKVAGEAVDLARVGIGVAVRDGAPKPDIGTVDLFRRALLAAKAVAYTDPAAGGSSGIYLSGLLDRLGIGAEVKAKAILVRGGYVAERVANGEAEIALHQISEILPVKGAVLVGPLPAEIQNYTVYAAGIAASSSQKASAQRLIDLLRSGEGAAVIRSKGMEPLGQAQPARN